jgi:hypothetical protein
MPETYKRILSKKIREWKSLGCFMTPSVTFAERRIITMEEWKNQSEVTVKELIEVLCRQDENAIVHNGNEENIRIYPGNENKEGGRNVIMIC